MSSSHDDTIIIWDFLNPEQPEIETNFNDTLSKLNNLSSNSTGNGFNNNNNQANNSKTQFNNSWLPPILNATNSNLNTNIQQDIETSPNQSPTMQHRKNQNSPPSPKMEMEGDD